MFKHPAILLGYFKYSILPAVLASIPMIFFIKDARFSQTWLLYLGDAIFLFSMIVVILMLSKTANHNAGTMSLLIAGLAITVFSIIIIFFITFILLIIFIPGLFHSGSTEGLEKPPANMVFDKTHGLMYVLFMNAFFGTAAAGSFVSTILSYTAKRNQKTDKAEL